MEPTEPAGVLRASPKPTNEASAAEIFDRDAALARVEGDLDLLRELVRVFVDDCPRLLAEIRAAVTAGDSVRLKRAAHNLRGAVGNFAAPVADEASLRLEAIGCCGDLTGAAAAAADVEQALQRLRPALLDLTK